MADKNLNTPTVSWQFRRDPDEWCSTLPPYFLTFPLLPLSFFHSKSNISQQHVRFVKTPFFSLVIYLIFRYKTCTGCLEQQQKYNIQLLCNFSSFNNHQFNRWILLGVSLPSDCSKSPNGLKSFWVLLGRGVWVGGWGTNKYIGQDAKKLKQGFWLFLNPHNRK